MRSRESRTLKLAALVALSVSGCGGDARPLGLASADAGGMLVPSGDAAVDGRSGPGLALVDSGNLDYTVHGGPDGNGDAGASGDGPCVHLDLDGKPDCTQTLTSNSDFNRNVLRWAAGGNTALRWVPLDVEGAPGSGSLAVKNIEKGDFDGQSLAPASQCLSAAAGTTYGVEAWVFIKGGQPYGDAQLAVWFYDQPDCADFVNGAIALSSIDSTDHWNLLKGGLVVPATSHSMSIHLVAQKPYRNDPLEVLFDAVRVSKVAK